MSEDRTILIACDESGNDGENVLAGGSPVFVHASVALSEDSAQELMDEIRRRTNSKSSELKSKTLLQPKHQDTALWLLEQLSVQTSATIHLIHKRYFLVAKLFDSTVEELAYALGEDMYENGGALSGATILFYLGPQCYGVEWDRLLQEFQEFLRAKTASEARVTLGRVRRRVELLLQDKDAPIRDILGPLYVGIRHLHSLSALQLGEGINERLRTGDPLLCAVGATVKHWSDFGNRAVYVIHDEAKLLTPDRVEDLKINLAEPERVALSKQGTGCVLAGLELVDSKADARVQVADLLAGISRVVAEHLETGKKHPLMAQTFSLLGEVSVWPIPDHMRVESARETMRSYRENFE